MFTSAFFSGNRAALRTRVQADYIILSASGLVQKTADETFPFRQDSNFWYLSGLQVADAVLVIDVKSGKDTLILPPRLKHRDLWEGAISHTELQKTSGISTILDADAGMELLKSLAVTTPKIGTIVPDVAYIPVYGMHISPTKIAFRNRLRHHFKKENFVDIRKDLAALRQVKQPQELKAIQKAVDATVQSIASLKSVISAMKTEQDVDIFLSYQFRLNGADGHAYSPIVASGLDAATIHHMDNNGPLAPDSLLLMDVGAQYQGYAADISRTYAIGEVSARQQAAYDAVKAAHGYALTLLKPGVVIREYQKQIVTFLVDELIKAGLYEKSYREQAQKDFPHLISHHLGLDVHDAGLYDEPLQAGAVVTVEPGVYLPGDKIGVRIEDDILITATGAKNLSAHLPDDLLYLG